MLLFAKKREDCWAGFPFERLPATVPWGVSIRMRGLDDRNLAFRTVREDETCYLLLQDHD
jgi:hypothetical protein